MKKMALCTPIPEAKLEQIKKFCDITVCGELKHGKGNVTEDQTREECRRYKGFKAACNGERSLH